MKNKVVRPITTLFTGFMFVCINALVYCSGGNRWLISKKLKIGAVLISLTAIIACGGDNNQREDTCYKTANPNRKDSIEKVRVREKDSIKKAKQDSMKAAKAKQKPVTKPNPTPVLMKTCYDYAEPPKRDSLNK
jgi:hypothetical protein